MNKSIPKKVLRIVLLDAFGIPSDLFALILGVYSMIDMLDTTLNVTGDVIVASIVDEIINSTSAKKQGTRNN